MTSTEVAISNPSGLTPSPSPISVSSALQEQVQQMAHAYTLAQSLCKTALVPQTFRGKPEDGAVAIMAGAKWGLDAIASLQNIFIVHGTPSTYARVMKAVVQANGHDIWTETVEPGRVVVCGQRKGSEKIERSEWTADRAKKAGYFSNKKYDTELENMLYARATAECARRTAPDCLLGMPYSREEMEDAGPRYVHQGTDKQSPQDAPIDVSDYAEPVDDVPPPPEPEATQTTPAGAKSERKISAPQLKALHAAFSGQKMTDRQEKLDWLFNLTGREITSTEDLTVTEASLAIDTLK
jgi:hypothetical protein